MKCPHCGHRASGASWYCAHCGRPFPDINVAGPNSAGRWLRPLALAAVAVLAIGAVAALAWTRGGLGGARPATATAGPVVVAGAPPASATPSPVPSPRIVTAVPGGQPPAATAGPTPSPFPTATVAFGEPVWRIGELTRPPRVDGSLDEWQALPLDINAVAFGAENWDGPADLSAVAFGGYDRRNLYLGVMVRDDVVSQPSRGVRLYLGDSLELQLDADRVGDAAVDSYNADDFQVGLSPGNFADSAPEAYIWRPDQTSPTDVVVAARRTGAGYSIEAALPWRLFGIDASRATLLGVALNVSDNDVAQPAQLTMLSSTPNRSWADPRSFGTLILLPAGARPTGTP